MGRQAYPIIGGIIGAAVTWYAGGTGYAAGYAIGAAIGGVVGSYADPIIIQGNTIGDAAIQTAAEGGARAIVIGTACVTATCVIARGNRRIVSSSSGGKGSSDDGSTVNQSVYWTFAIGLGEPTIGSKITRIWQDETLVYDVTGSTAISNQDNVAFAAKFRFYNGSDDQMPDPDLQVFLADDTPYFRGTTYVVFPNFDLTNTAERIPAFRFEVAPANTVASEIIAAIEGLAISYPTDGYPPHTALDSQQSVVNNMPGTPSVRYDVDLYVVGRMETRDYLNNLGNAGADGRFMLTDNGIQNATNFYNNNIYSIQIENLVGPSLWAVNNFTAGETIPVVFSPDGSDAYKLSVQVTGNYAFQLDSNPMDGRATSAPQGFHCNAVVRSPASDGTDPNKSEVSIATIAEILLKRVGMTSDQYDVSVLTDMVAGVCIQDTSSGADALNACVQPFFADPCEIDGVLTWVKRGGSVLRTLTIDDLTEIPDVASRENAIEYPAKLHFFYQSPITGYATTKATSFRYSPQIDSSSEGSVTTPITFDDANVPAQIAQKLHKTMWTEAEGSFQWTVSNQCIDLVPTDVLALDLRGIVTRVRVIGVEYDQPNTIALTLIKDRQSNCTSAATGVPLPTPTAPQPTTMSKAVLAVMDIPALQDTDDQLCYYTAMQGTSATWNGAELQRSLDGGSTWTTVARVNTASKMGKLTDSVSAHLKGYTDTTNTVTVQLFNTSDELLSYSDTQFLQEQGGIAVQFADGTWEVMQYRDAVDNGGGSWSLSYLQRGRVNTSSFGHPTGSLFVVLDSRVSKNAAQVAWLGGTMMHRAVSYGTSSENADVVSTVYNGLSQQEWSPAYGLVDYDGKFAYLHDIVPRHRFGTEVTPVASQNFQGYQITCVASGMSGTTKVIATLLTNSGHIDTSALIGSLTSVEIAEVNKITGPGDPYFPFITTVASGSLTPVAIINAGGDD